MLERVAQERYPRLVAHGMVLTGSQAEAEDLVQDALVATFVGRARFATVEQALASQSPRERACVVLRHMEDLSVRETAQLLRLSEGAVKRYVSDGVASLNAALGTATDDDEVVPVHRVSAGGARPDGRGGARAGGRADVHLDGSASDRADDRADDRASDRADDQADDRADDRASDRAKEVRRDA